VCNHHTVTTTSTKVRFVFESYKTALFYSSSSARAVFMVVHLSRKAAITTKHKSFVNITQQIARDVTSVMFMYASTCYKHHRLHICFKAPYHGIYVSTTPPPFCKQICSMLHQSHFCTECFLPREHALEGQTPTTPCPATASITTISRRDAVSVATGASRL
jgi:hypothetical protein